MELVFIIYKYHFFRKPDDELDRWRDFLWLVAVLLAAIVDFLLLWLLVLILLFGLLLFPITKYSEPTICKEDKETSWSLWGLQYSSIQANVVADMLSKLESETIELKLWNSFSMMRRNYKFLYKPPPIYETYQVSKTVRKKNDK